MDSQIKVTFFGKPHIQYEDATIKLRRRKSMAMLAYLATSGYSEHRVRLITLLWPEASTKVGQSSLRNVLADLNATPLSDYLIVNGDRVGLSPDLEIDVRRFINYVAQIRQKRCRVEHLDVDCLVWMNEALTLYVGDFMGHFNVKGSPEFDDWLVVQRFKYQQLVEDIIDVLAQHYWQIGEDATAFSLVERWLQIDPYDERASRLSMHLYARNDQVSRAIEQYHLLVRLLHHNFDRDPDADTKSLYEMIRNGTYPDRRSSAIWGKRVRSVLPSAPRVFFGREKELDWIKTRLNVHDTVRNAVMVVGELGVGKSALVAQLAYDEDVRDIFPDGILWATLGSSPDLSKLLRLWLDALRISELPHTRSSDDLSMQLAAGLYDKRMLLIVDDVRSVEDARPFASAQIGSITLFTTRLPRIARHVAVNSDNIMYLQPLTGDEAHEILIALAPQLTQQDSVSTQQLIEHYQGLPLAMHVLAQLSNQQRFTTLGEIVRVLSDPRQILSNPVPIDQRIVSGKKPTIFDIVSDYFDLVPLSIQSKLQAVLTSYPDRLLLDEQDLYALWQTENHAIIDEMLDYGVMLLAGDKQLRVNVLLAAYLHTITAP